MRKTTNRQGVHLARKLTEKQENYKNLRVQGVSGPDAYRKAYKSKANPKNVSKEATKLDEHPLIAPELKQLREEVTKKVLCDAEWIARGLMKEAQGELDGCTGSSRVSAYKALSDYTGGFDANKHKIEVTHAVKDMTDEKLDEYIKELQNGQS